MVARGDRSTFVFKPSKERSAYWRFLERPDLVAVSRLQQRVILEDDETDQVVCVGSLHCRRVLASRGDECTGEAAM